VLDAPGGRGGVTARSEQTSGRLTDAFRFDSFGRMSTRPYSPGTPGARPAARWWLALVLFVALAGVWPNPLLAAPPARWPTVSVAAASDLASSVEALTHAFTNRHPAQLQIVLGSSGNFFAQIQRGAPFDVFLSADMNYARALATNGLADPATLHPYAIGRLVLWTTRDDLLVEGGLGVLTNPAVRRVAIANPSHAPYGRAAREALIHAGLWDTLQARIVLGENIAQTAQFVHSGNADAGLVALALVTAPRLTNAGRWWPVPESAHRPLEQGLIVTRRGTTNASARAFIEFMLAPEAGAVLKRAGFRRPSSHPASP